MGNILGVDLIRKNLRGISILKQIEILEIRNFILKNEFSPKYHKTGPGKKINSSDTINFNVFCNQWCNQSPFYSRGA